MSGKGSKQRPTNLEAFSSNYDAIFRKQKDTDQTLTEFVVVEDENKLYEVDQHKKMLINE